MRTRIGIGATFGSAFLGALMAHAALQTPAAPAVDETVFREYAGVYQCGPNAFVYLQMWDEGKPGGNRDYALKVLPKANHYQWEAKVGSNAEMASLKRFVPEYFTTIQDWLGKHIRGFGAYR